MSIKESQSSRSNLYSSLSEAEGVRFGSCQVSFTCLLCFSFHHNSMASHWDRGGASTAIQRRSSSKCLCNWRVLSNLTALALPEKNHRSLMHISLSMIPEAGVSRAYNEGVVVVSWVSYLFIESIVQIEQFMDATWSRSYFLYLSHRAVLSFLSQLEIHFCTVLIATQRFFCGGSLLELELDWLTSPDILADHVQFWADTWLNWPEVVWCPEVNTSTAHCCWHSRLRVAIRECYPMG